MIRVSAGAVIAAALVFAAYGGVASAQYPPPEGNCVLSLSSTTVPPGGSAGVTVTVRDVNGNPLANTNVTLSITKQPGAGASVTPASATTDANGMVTATVNAGTTGGVIEVTASAPNVKCSGSLAAGSSAVEVVAAPNTGTGDASRRAGASPLAAALVLLAAGGAAVALAAARTRGAR